MLLRWLMAVMKLDGVLVMKRVSLVMLIYPYSKVLNNFMFLKLTNYYPIIDSSMHPEDQDVLGVVIAEAQSTGNLQNHHFIMKHY